MSNKSILVVETPKSCSDCRLVAEDKDGLWCSYTRYDGCNIRIAQDNCISPWCPLRPLPDKQPIINYPEEHENDYANGWNACLDEITREENDI